MKVVNIIPQEKIAAYVERILAIENDEVISPYNLPLFANAVPALLFISVKGSFKNSSASYLTLFGQTVFPDTLTLNDNFTLIAYFLKPYALINFFGFSAQELTDHPIDLSLLAPKTSNSLQEQLLNETLLKNRIFLLDEYIFTLINKAKESCAIIKYATDIIVKKPAKESLKTIQSELHITERTFQRLFEKNVGIAPNLYRRICQFNAAFQQLNSKKYDKLTDIAFSHGYADQSHYIRAFKEFTNITPSDYFNFGSNR